MSSKALRRKRNPSQGLPRLRRIKHIPSHKLRQVFRVPRLLEHLPSQMDKDKLYSVISLLPRPRAVNVVGHARRRLQPELRLKLFKRVKQFPRANQDKLLLLPT